MILNRIVMTATILGTLQVFENPLKINKTLNFVYYKNRTMIKKYPVCVFKEAKGGGKNKI